MICPKCGLTLKPFEHLICLECDPSIQEGCAVQENLSGNHGTAFIRNSIGQWLVYWNDGSVNVVHERNIKRIS